MAVIRIGRSRVSAPSLSASIVLSPSSRLSRLDELEHDDGIGDHDPDQHQQSEHRGQAQLPSGDSQGREGADRGQRQRQEDHERGQEAAEGVHHRQVDESDGDGHGSQDAGEALLLLLRFSAKTGLDARRERELVERGLRPPC